MNHFYVYLHMKKDTKEVFYVGKGCGQRAYSKKRNQYWHNIVNKNGYIIKIVSKNLNENLALKIEETLICFYKIKHLAEANICISGGLNGLTGKPCPEMSKQKSKEASSGENSKVAKKVINILTNEIWHTISGAAKANNLTQPTLTRYLLGKRENITNLRLLQE